MVNLELEAAVQAFGVALVFILVLLQLKYNKDK
jgi:hypothetical protein